VCLDDLLLLHQNHIHLNEREKEKSNSFIKRSTQKDSSSTVDNKSCSSEANWSIICSQTPIPASESIPGEVKPDENHFGQEVWLEWEVPHQHQCDERNPSVDSMDKEKSIITSSEAESTTGDHNDRCSPLRMKSNPFIYQTFQFPQPPPSNSN
jgi:hypothetical protein